MKKTCEKKILGLLIKKKKNVWVRKKIFAVKITPAPQKSPPLKNLTGQLLKLTTNLDSLQNFKPENIFLR